jgi:hypothetical protein
VKWYDFSAVMGKAVWRKRKIEGYTNVECDLSGVKMLSQKVLIKPSNTAGR